MKIPILTNMKMVLFKYFTATIAAGRKVWDDYYASSRVPFVIIFYGDDVELYRITVEKETKPQEININVTGVEQLKIRIDKGNHGSVILANGLLYKR